MDARTLYVLVGPDGEPMWHYTRKTKLDCEFIGSGFYWQRGRFIPDKVGVPRTTDVEERGVV